MDRNNVLVLGPPKSGKIRFAQFISGDYETETISDDSHSGLMYKCNLKTKYFSVDVNLLIEEFPESRKEPEEKWISSLQTWFGEFESDTMADLREVIEGVVFTVCVNEWDDNVIKQQLDILSNMKDLLKDNDPFFIVMGVSEHDIEQDTMADLEDLVLLNGFEFVYFNDSGMNEFRDKMGKDRLLEVLETHEWTQKHLTHVSNEDYMAYKKEKMTLMTQGLLQEDDCNIPTLDVLLQKLQIEKLKVEEMKENERKGYVDGLVDEFLEYF